jgi:hypothetical protein
MLTKKPQAITGVSPEHETVIEELYPSIAITPLGDFIHRLLDCIPTRVWGLKVSNVLFGLPVAPIAATVYLWMKFFGSKYVVTNRVVKRVDSIGFRQNESVPLSQILTATVDPDSRMEFYKTGDVRLSGAGGQSLLLLRGVPRPERFCQVIQEACDAKRLVANSLSQIKARH